MASGYGETAANPRPEPRLNVTRVDDTFVATALHRGAYRRFNDSSDRRGGWLALGYRRLCWTSTAEERVQSMLYAGGMLLDIADVVNVAGGDRRKLRRCEWVRIIRSGRVQAAEATRLLATEPIDRMDKHLPTIRNERALQNGQPECPHSEVAEQLANALNALHLDGAISGDDLVRLKIAIREERAMTDDPRLESLLDEIETRAAVEAAKMEMAQRAA